MQIKKTESTVNTCTFEEIPVNGFFMCNGKQYLKLKQHWEDNNSYNTQTHEFAEFSDYTKVFNSKQSLTVTPIGTPFRDINIGDHFIYEGNICTRYMTGSYCFIIANGESLYISPDTVVEPADIIMLVNTDKTCNRFRSSMMLLNTVWSVAQNKLPLIKALRTFGDDIGITIGLKEAKDWVEANLK